MSVITINMTARTDLKIILRRATGGNVCIAVTRSGLPVSLVGATIKFVVATPIPITKTIGSGIVVTNAPAGEFTISFVALDTETLINTALMSAQHQCNVQLLGEEPRDIFMGQTTLHPSLITSMI